MKRATAATAVLAAAAVGAALMVIFSAEKSAVVSTASVASPPSTTVAPVTTTPETTPETTPAASTLSAQQSQALAESAQQALRESVPGATLGMEVYDRQTSTVLTSLNADQQFASMSVVKLLIAIDVLAQNQFELPSTATQTQITQMLSTSDDAIASSFWVSEGGTSIITRDVALMGLTGTAAPTSAGEWGSTEITAQDMVTVYDYVLDKLPAPARSLLYDAMYHASEDAADGTDQYFGIPDGLRGTTWAIKQGWGSSGSDAYYNSTGVLGTDSRYVVVLLSSGPLSSYGTLPTALTSAAAALSSLVSP